MERVSKELDPAGRGSSRAKVSGAEAKLVCLRDSRRPRGQSGVRELRQLEGEVREKAGPRWRRALMGLWDHSSLALPFLWRGHVPICCPVEPMTYNGASTPCPTPTPWQAWACRI